MKRFPRGYYRLENGAVVRLAVRDTGGTIHARNTAGDRLQFSREDFAKATNLQHYRPTSAQIWADSEKAGLAVKTEPKFREFIVAVKRNQVFIESLVEFNYIRVDFCGYYGGSTTRKNFMGEPAREVIVERLSGELAMSLAYCLLAEESATADVKARKRELFETWAANPCQETFKKMRPGGVCFSGPECHVTGLRIQWDYDGQTIRPVRYWDGDRREYAVLPRFHGVNGHLPAASYTIDIPSGKIALFQWINDPGLVKDQPHEERESVNSEAGRIAYSRYFEKLGFWHLYVGGRGRRLYRKGKAFRIGYKPEDNRTKHEAAIWRGWKEVGAISFRTDLRWFTACDASKLKPKHFEEDEILVVKVPPGRYTLIDQVEHVHEETIYATVSKTTKHHDQSSQDALRLEAK
jgi:hypothetical protein